MKDTLNFTVFCLLLSFISANTFATTLAEPIFLNMGYKWQLKKTGADNIVTPTQNKNSILVVHVNKHLESDTQLLSDTIELSCGDEHISFDAGTTGSCELPANTKAIVSIKSNKFSNGAEGSLIFVE
jgi:hypothetical protein